MYKLRMLFFKLIRLANQHRDPVYGDPCSYLTENMVLYQERFISQFENARDTRCDSHEIRLNGAGLKLLWIKYDGRYWFSIAGDQKDLYPRFVATAIEALRVDGYKSITKMEV